MKLWVALVVFAQMALIVVGVFVVIHFISKFW